MFPWVKTIFVAMIIINVFLISQGGNFVIGVIAIACCVLFLLSYRNSGERV